MTDLKRLEVDLESEISASGYRTENDWLVAPKLSNGRSALDERSPSSSGVKARVESPAQTHL